MQPPLRAAAVTVTTQVNIGEPTAGYTGAVVKRVAGPLKTTLTLLAYGPRRLCLVASHFGTSGDDATLTLQEAISSELGLARAEVVVFTSHNHSVPLLEKTPLRGYLADPPKSDPTSLGKRVVRQLRQAAASLPSELEPVTISYGEGREGRITYNRKGRRADGTTYLVREEDRVLLGADFRGDIDEQAPIICLKRTDGSPLTYIVQFTGHPVTTYHPEQLIACGDYAQFACDLLASSNPRDGEVPVSFLQGCAGEINSKKMFSGNVELARRYGSYLGGAYVKALRSMRPSVRPGFGLVIEKVNVPLARLPRASVLQRELAEMQDFVRRGAAGDEDTLTCVGLNFPRAMTPAYRAKLIEYTMPWNQWALKLHAKGRAHTVPTSIGIDVHVLRLGDAGIVGMACEPFLGIGRQIRRACPLPLAVPCGYTNQSTGFVGYVPDSPNVGDQEYQSAFYRYTRYLPPFRKPAGDVLAQAALRHLRRLAQNDRL